MFAVDFAGAAKNCIVPKPALKDGETTDMIVKMGNDGGWCGITADRSGAKSFEAGLLTRRPTHGKVFIHAVGDAIRIDYTPDRSFTGSDNFAVKLIPGNTTIDAQVTVAP